MHTMAGKLSPSLPAGVGGALVPSSRGPEASQVPAVYGTTEERIDYLALLRRHRLAVTVIVASCLLAGILYSHLAPQSYKVQTVLEITGLNQDFMNLHDIDPSAGAGDAASYLETQIMLLQNESVVDHVIAAMSPTVPARIASDDSGREGVIRRMLAGAKAKEEGQSNLVRITLTGPDPQLVANTANELTKQYMQQGQDAHLAAASETGVFLQQQMSEAKHKLQASEDGLQEYARSSGIVLTNDTHESVATEHLREIQQGLAQAEVDRASRESQMEMAQRAPIEALPQVIDDPTIREDRAKLTELHRQMAELSTTMTPANYKVAKVKAQIQDLEAEIGLHRTIIVNRLSIESRTAARREELLKQQYEQQRAIVEDQGGKQVHYNMLKHDVDVNQQIYQSMLQKVKEAGVVAALRASNARVVSPAKAPLSPYSPKTSTSFLLSALPAIVLSLLYILISERKDQSVRNPGESEIYVDRPELAVIPQARTRSRLHKPRITSVVGVDSGPTRVHPMLGHWKEDDKTFLAEAYRSAGTSILFSRKGGLAPKVLLVTSPHPQCGKTTTTANLAISLAEGGRRVLLIDGDLRRPALAQLFGMPNERGLTNALDENERADPYKVVQATAFAGVHLLPSGATKGSVARLLHSTYLESVIDTARNDFDFVLIDAPPLLGLSDARILSKFADGVILVCRSGRTRTDDLDEARRLLVEDGTHIFGTILNGYDLQHERSAHYQSYLRYFGKAAS